LVSGFGTVSILYVLGWMGVGKPTTWPSLNTSAIGLLADPTGYGPLLAASALNPERIALGPRGELGPQGENFVLLDLFDLDPVLYGLAVSFVLGIIVSLLTRTLLKEHVDRYFLADA